MIRPGIIAEKIGMLQFFDADGMKVPVTALKVDPCHVVSLRAPTDPTKLGAVQLGAREVSARKLSKSMQGYFQKKNLPYLRFLKEFAVSSDHTLKQGDVLSAEHFVAGQYVDVTGTSIGKGFAGAMKRHNFGGLRASHGVSVSHRSHGSTGNRQDPGKVFKNKKMAGHMGARRVTTLSLVVFGVDKEKGVLFIKGSVPGCRGGKVFVRDAIKKVV